MNSKVSCFPLQSKLLKFTNYYGQIVLQWFLWAGVASCMPTGEVIPDQDAWGQFLYSYGYGYPSIFAYQSPSANLPAAYYVPVG